MLSRVRVVYERCVSPMKEGRKRGGIRVIYYWWSGGAQFWLFTLYGKDVQDDLSAAQKKVLKSLLDTEVNARKKP